MAYSTASGQVECLGLFHRQQVLLAPDPAAIAGEFTIGSDDTVANAKQSNGSPKKASPSGKGGKKATASAAEEVFKKVGSLRTGGKPMMPYTQSEVSLVALDREGVW